MTSPSSLPELNHWTSKEIRTTKYPTLLPDNFITIESYNVCKLAIVERLKELELYHHNAVMQPDNMAFTQLQVKTMIKKLIAELERKDERRSNLLLS